MTNAYEIKQSDTFKEVFYFKTQSFGLSIDALDPGVIADIKQ